jgi:hypothetical protein
VNPNPASGERGDPNRRPADRADDAPASTPWAAIDAAERRAGRRRTLLILAAFLLVVCLVGGIGGYVWYDRTTRIDRSTPVVVVFQYVDAIFELRDVDHARLFECERSNGRAALQMLLSDIMERERKFDIRLSVSAGDFESAVEGAQAEVRTSLFIDAPEVNGETSRSSQPWKFTLHDDDGWRVCSAQRVS